MEDYLENLTLNSSPDEDNIDWFYTATSSTSISSSNASTLLCICFNGNSNNTVVEHLDFCNSQEAELKSIYRALLSIQLETCINIVSRSNFAVKCINEWSLQWKAENWKILLNNASPIKLLTKSIVDEIDMLTEDNKIIKILDWSEISDKAGSHIAYTVARESLNN